VKWLIWSNEHSAWWAPNSCGYVKERSKAGRYELMDALTIVADANQHLPDNAAPDETMVAENVVVVRRGEP
jgi:hypothetical protein